MFCTTCGSYIDNESTDCPSCGRSSESAPAIESSWSTRWLRRKVPGSYLLRALLALAPVAILLLAAGAYRQHVEALEQKREQAYERSVQAFAEGDYEVAQNGFSALGTYRDSEAKLAEVLSQAAPLHEQLQAAHEAYIDRDYESAIELLTTVLNSAPEYSDAVDLLASVRESYANELMLTAALGETSRDWSAVEQSLRTALLLQPDNASLATEVDFVLSNHAPVVYTRDGVVLISGPSAQDERALTADIGATWPSWSPDRRQIAFLTPTPKSSRFDATLMIMNADGSGLRSLIDRVIPLSAPQWSPDGSSIVYASIQNFDEGSFTGRISLDLMNLDTGVATDLTGEGLNHASSPSWSPDGEHLAFVSLRMERRRGGNLTLLDGDVWTVAVRTGELINVTRGELEDENWVYWSPDGDRMLILTNPGEWSDPEMMHLFLVELGRDWDPVEIAMDWQISLPAWSPDGSRFAYITGGSEVRIWTDGVEEWIEVLGKLAPHVSWSPDGSRLLLPTSSPPNPSWLLSVDENFGELVSVRIDADGLGVGSGFVMWAPMTPASIAGFDFP